MVPAIAAAPAAAGAGKGAAAGSAAGSAAATGSASAITAATKAALLTGGLTAAGGIASGIAGAMLQKDPKDAKLSMPNASPGGVGARPAGQPLYAGRQEFNNQRQSLASQLLARR